MVISPFRWQQQQRLRSRACVRVRVRNSLAFLHLFVSPLHAAARPASGPARVSNDRFFFFFFSRIFHAAAAKMPVFHTKTIESILEPVAQQVSDPNRDLVFLSVPIYRAIFFFFYSACAWPDCVLSHKTKKYFVINVIIIIVIFDFIFSSFNSISRILDRARRGPVPTRRHQWTRRFRSKFFLRVYYKTIDLRARRLIAVPYNNCTNSVRDV